MNTKSEQTSEIFRTIVDLPEPEPPVIPIILTSFIWFPPCIDINPLLFMPDKSLEYLPPATRRERIDGRMPIRLVRTENTIGKIPVIRSVREELRLKAEAGVTAIADTPLTIFRPIKEIPCIELDRRLGSLDRQRPSADWILDSGEFLEDRPFIGQHEAMVVPFAADRPDIPAYRLRGSKVERSPDHRKTLPRGNQCGVYGQVPVAGQADLMVQHGSSGSTCKIEIGMVRHVERSGLVRRRFIVDDQFSVVLEQIARGYRHRSGKTSVPVWTMERQHQPGHSSDLERFSMPHTETEAGSPAMEAIDPPIVRLHLIVHAINRESPLRDPIGESSDRQPIGGGGPKFPDAVPKHDIVDGSVRIGAWKACNVAPND